MSKFTRELKKIMLTYSSLDRFARDSHTAFKSFGDEVEQLAADEYGHRTEDGWCCACEADKAFMYSTLESEGWKPPTPEHKVKGKE